MSTLSGVDATGFTMLCEAGCRHNICGNCGEPFRLHNQLAKDHPGTIVGVKSRGICQGCINSNGRVTPRPARASRPDNCLRCSAKLRPAHSSLERHPGTVEHRGKGLCTHCFSVTPPAERDEYMTRYNSQGLGQDEDARLRNAARSVYDLMKRRRDRGVPRDGSRKPVRIV